MIEDIDQLATQLRQNRAVLDIYRTDEIGALIGAAAVKWGAPSNQQWADLEHQGLHFLRNWCRSTHLRAVTDEGFSCDGAPSTDSSSPLADQKRARIAARIVGHWLSGNVPLLGMLAIVQALLTRNANIVKPARTFASALPALLESFRGLRVTTAAGRVIDGDDVLKTIAVVYFPPETPTSQRTCRWLAMCAWPGAVARRWMRSGICPNTTIRPTSCSGRNCRAW